MIGLKNRSIFGEDMNNSLVSCFLTHRVHNYTDVISTSHRYVRNVAREE